MSNMSLIDKYKSSTKDSKFEDIESYKQPELAVGDIVRIKPSKRNSQPIAFSQCGKVILFKNSAQLKYGFGKIKSVLERPNCFICVAENCVYDFYTGLSESEVISLHEFEQVLQNLGFRKQYETDIDEFDKMYVWANLDLRVLIKFETWSKKFNKDYTVVTKTYMNYNSVDVMLIADKAAYSDLHNISGWQSIWGSYVVVDLVSCKMDYPLHKLLELTSGLETWGDRTPGLWHYGEKDIRDFSVPLSRILDFKDDVVNIFGIHIEEALEVRREFAQSL